MKQQLTEVYFFRRRNSVKKMADHCRRERLNFGFVNLNFAVRADFLTASKKPDCSRGYPGVTISATSYFVKSLTEDLKPCASPGHKKGALGCAVD